jgi:CarboxypepD_reg-like domain
MKAVTFSFLWLTIFSSTLSGQTSLAGKIIDNSNKEELIAANVALFRNGVLITGVATDFEGMYSVTLDPGFYDVEVSYVGYQNCLITGVMVVAGAANQLNIGLGTDGGKQISHFTNQNKRYGSSRINTVAFHSPPMEEFVIELLENEPKKDY